MLVLTRKGQEQIRIGEDITITILRIQGRTVRVGIDAPRQIRVVRGELPLHLPKRTNITETGAHSDSTVSPQDPATDETSTPPGSSASSDSAGHSAGDLRRPRRHSAV